MAKCFGPRWRFRADAVPMVDPRRVQGGWDVVPMTCLFFKQNGKLGTMLLWWQLRLGFAEKDLFIPLRREGSPRERELVEELRQWNGYAFKVTGRRVVAAMTTTPRRIALIEPVIDSLLNQSRVLDMIYLFVPRTFLRDSTIYDIPEWLESKASKVHNFQLRRCVDSGPATHMHQVLRMERNPKTYILQVDDDQIYGHRLLEKLLTATGPLPGRAIGAATQHAYHYLQGAVMEGVHGVLFQRKFFDSWASNYEGFPSTCRLHDDLWFSAHLARKGFHRESLFNRFGSTAQKFGFDADALFRGGAGTSNRWNFLSCMAALLKAQPELWDFKDRIAVLAPWSTYSGRAAGDVARSKAGAMRRMTALRRGEGGPDALYWFGPVGGQLLQHLKERLSPEMMIPDGLVTTTGTWNGTMEVYLRDCQLSGACSYSDALRFLLSLEEDPLTLLVVLAAEPNQKQLDARVEEHLQCHLRSSLRSRQLCRGRHGSISFRRHAASNLEDVSKIVFMPHFSADFQKPAGPTGEMKGPDLDWIRDSAVYFGHFEDALAVSPHTRRVVDAWFSERRRVVALLWPSWGTRGANMAGALRSVRRQKPHLQRVYLYLEKRRCVSGPLAHWHRVRVLCSQEPGLMELFRRECRDDTVILLGEVGVRSRLPYTQLLQGLHLWSGHAVAGQAAKNLLPHMQSGFLLKRGFLDLRILDELNQLEGHNDSHHLSCAANLLVQNLHLKGITWKVLRGHLAPGSPRSAPARCPAPGPVWAPRCVLFVSLPPVSEEILELTLRLAAAQSRKPEEVVLVTAGESNLDDTTSVDEHSLDLGLLEVHLEGEVAGASSLILRGRSRRRRSQLPLSLSELLRLVISKKVSCVIRKRTRSFVLSAVSCGEPLCSPRSILSVAFAREWEPATVLMFAAPERLVNERLIEDNEDCISACGTSFDQEKWRMGPDKELGDGESTGDHIDWCDERTTPGGATLARQNHRQLVPAVRRASRPRGWGSFRCVRSCEKHSTSAI
eukprot:s79_g40.t1